MKINHAYCSNDFIIFFFFLFSFWRSHKLSANKVLFSTHPKEHTMGVLFYLARHVVVAHLEHLQLVPNLLKIFGTPSSIFVQLG